MPYIDLNADAGEGYGAWQMGDDKNLFNIISSVNIACGGHAGDYQTMYDTIALAKNNSIGIGAHPSFEDKMYFGRRVIPMSPSEIEKMVAYQIGGISAIAALQGTKLNHVKAHGALANLAAADRSVADAIARACKSINPELILLAIAGTQLQKAGEAAGLMTVAEGFADRSYDDKGFLIPRGQKGAVIHDPDITAQRCVDMAEGKGLPKLAGGYVPIQVQSICVHGDTPGAVQIAAACRKQLEAAGFTIQSFSA